MDQRTIVILVLFVLIAIFCFSVLVYLWKGRPRLAEDGINVIYEDPKGRWWC